MLSLLHALSSLTLTPHLLGCVSFSGYFISCLAGTVCTVLKSSVYVLNSSCKIALDIILTLGCPCEMAY